MTTIEIRGQRYLSGSKHLTNRGCHFNVLVYQRDRLTLARILYVKGHPNRLRWRRLYMICVVANFSNRARARQMADIENQITKFVMV